MLFLITHFLRSFQISSCPAFIFNLPNLEAALRFSSPNSNRSNFVRGSIARSRLTEPAFERRTIEECAAGRHGVHAALSFAHYPSTGTIDEPTPMLVRLPVPYLAFDEMEI